MDKPEITWIAVDGRRKAKNLGVIKINGKMVAGFSIDDCTGHTHILANHDHRSWRGRTFEEAIQSMMDDLCQTTQSESV
jgi:hypothetical protein